jgi:hypothetical protein
MVWLLLHAVRRAQPLALLRQRAPVQLQPCAALSGLRLMSENYAKVCFETHCHPILCVSTTVACFIKPLNVSGRLKKAFAIVNSTHAGTGESVS